MRSIAVIGLGKFGSTVARELTERGARVIAIDEDRERVEAIKESVAYAVTLNSTDKAALESVAIRDVDVAVVCIGEDVEANLLTTLLLKKLGVKKIWARAITELQLEILKTLEVDDIINLEEEMGITIAQTLASANVGRYIPLSEGHSIAEIKLPDVYVGKTLREINLREKHRINVVALKRFVPAIDDLGERILKESIDNVPSSDEKLVDDVVLIVAGANRDIDRFSRG